VWLSISPPSIADIMNAERWRALSPMSSHPSRGCKNNASYTVFDAAERWPYGQLPDGEACARSGQPVLSAGDAGIGVKRRYNDFPILTTGGHTGGQDF